MSAPEDIDRLERLLAEENAAGVLDDAKPAFLSHAEARWALKLALRLSEAAAAAPPPSPQREVFMPMLLPGPASPAIGELLSAGLDEHGRMIACVCLTDLAAARAAGALLLQGVRSVAIVENPIAPANDAPANNASGAAP